ncbi:MAG: hypothetical protein Q6373_006420 [Candidatus Sigynarchaeota archaeon]
MAFTVNDPFLYAMYCIEAFIDFELFVFFILKWKPQKTRHISILGLAYLCFGITRVLLIFWDFESPKNATYYISAAFFAFLAMAVFMYAAEYLLRKTHYVFTIAFLAVSCIVLFLTIDVLRHLYYIFASALILFVIAFLFRLMAMVTGSVRKRFFTLFIGFVFYGLGYALSAELAKQLVPRPISVAVVIIGLAFIALACVRIPMLEEVHWMDYLLHIFAFHIDTSACIHDETLLKTGREMQGVSADLFSSGVTGVIGIIKEMINSEKKLKVLDHEDKKILLEYGKYITVALITRKDLDILHEKLLAYINRAETELRQPLEKWRGEVARFAGPMQAITADIFKTAIDKNWWRVNPRSIAHQVARFVKGLFPKGIFKHAKNTEGQETRTSEAGVKEQKTARAEPPIPKAKSEPVEPENDPWPAPNPAKPPVPDTTPQGITPQAVSRVEEEKPQTRSDALVQQEKPAKPAKPAKPVKKPAASKKK